MARVRSNVHVQVLVRDQQAAVLSGRQLHPTPRLGAAAERGHAQCQAARPVAKPLALAFAFAVAVAVGVALASKLAVRGHTLLVIGSVFVVFVLDRVEPAPRAAAASAHPSAGGGKVRLEWAGTAAAGNERAVELAQHAFPGERAVDCRPVLLARVPARRAVGIDCHALVRQPEAHAVPLAVHVRGQAPCGLGAVGLDVGWAVGLHVGWGQGGVRAPRLFQQEQSSAVPHGVHFAGGALLLLLVPLVPLVPLVLLHDVVR